MKNDKSDTIKKAIIENLEDGNTISTSCSNVDVSRNTFYRWLKEDPNFKQEVEIAQESRIKMVEDALYKSAIEGDHTAQIFFLCNRAKDKWQDVSKVEHGIASDTLSAIFEKLEGKLKEGNNNASK